MMMMMMMMMPLPLPTRAAAVRPLLLLSLLLLASKNVRSFSSSTKRTAVTTTLMRTTTVVLFSTSSDPGTDRSSTYSSSSSSSSSSSHDVTVDSVDEATRILAEWDGVFGQLKGGDDVPPEERLRREQLEEETAARLSTRLEPSIRFLSGVADDDRDRDPTLGRLILGICAGSAEEGVATLKAWVTALSLPRGLLHGMDKDGVPVDLSGAVYIKYNSGGVYTFSDIRKSGLGFDALWKPGDALLEPYDGTYRGVYFQVELGDEQFRQFLVPLDVF